MKNPICRAGTFPSAGTLMTAIPGRWTTSSATRTRQHLRRRCQRQERQRDASHTLAEFVEFLRREDASVLPVMGAIAATTTPAAAAEVLGIAKTDFRRLHNRLRTLAQFFLVGGGRRRFAKLKTHCVHHCEIAATHAVHSCTAWNRLELYSEVWNQPLIKLSRKYGISDVRLGKVCRKLKIPHPGRGYWAKRRTGKPVLQPPLTVFEDAPLVRRMKTKNAIAARQGLHAQSATRKRARHEGRGVVEFGGTGKIRLRGVPMTAFA